MVLSRKLQTCARSSQPGSSKEAFLMQVFPELLSLPPLAKDELCRESRL